MNEKRMKAAANQAVSYRNYRRARDRALVRLAQAYPETYKELLELEKASDETTGAKWLDIDGNTVLTVGIRTPKGVSHRTIETNDQYEDESDNGGEA
jgi:predicted RNase H-like nuclease (RuvC/YqgF family)